ncbi:hypothetical protein DFS33DRAFT_1273605 [Desarmillaria ectypa]|nr:hypothetical protein DFS33DRAFT_1273605 [Desarmillaria ectypa]
MAPNGQHNNLIVVVYVEKRGKRPAWRLPESEVGNDPRIFESTTLVAIKRLTPVIFLKPRDKRQKQRTADDYGAIAAVVWFNQRPRQCQIKALPHSGFFSEFSQSSFDSYPLHSFIENPMENERYTPCEESTQVKGSGCFGLWIVAAQWSWEFGRIISFPSDAEHLRVWVPVTLRYECTDNGNSTANYLITWGSDTGTTLIAALLLSLKSKQQETGFGGSAH